MHAKSQKLGQILCEEGIIQENQLTEILELQKSDSRRLGELLMDRGLIDPKRLTESLSRLHQFPFVQLNQQPLDPQVVRLVPFELLQAHRVVPISVEDQKLLVATNNPLDVNALQEIQLKSGYSVYPVMASMQDIERTLQEYFDAVQTGKSMKTAQGTTASLDDSSVINYVDSIIRRAVKERASDIHFEPQRGVMRVRFRIDGHLYEKESISQELQRNCISRIKIISGLDVAENRRPQDGRCHFNVGKEEYDLRISTLPNINGENMVVRILSTTFANRSFTSLGMSPKQADDISELLDRPYGLILLTGPTGAGKTTTLYSMLNQLNQIDRSIVTVEDPVEYELPGINQTATNPHIGYTFAKAIRH
ncbi:MAG: Flp pilus assembly complex ATPase component TadA, partial [Candidatus Omnitrophica bacterium]|nr:Flp pilus assembly complex ATPase component TadA [Candidatus Omnitrophota bacterium]